MNTVSVILPTYNRAVYVKDAIESVLAQTHDDIELIVVDDGSTDNTAEQIRPCLSDPRMRYIRQENAGAAAARNRGLSAATGDYAAFIDSDDLWDRDKLKVQLSVMRAIPDISMVFSDFSAVNSSGYIERSHIRTYFSVLDEYSLSFEEVFANKMIGGIEGLKENEAVYWGNIFETMLFGNIMLTSTTLFRRAVFEEAGLFDTRYGTLEDYDLFLRLSKRLSAAFVDRPLIVYRYSSNQLSGDLYYGKLCDVLIDIFNRHVDGIRDSEFFALNRKKFRRRLGIYEAQKAYFHFARGDTRTSSRYYRRSILKDPWNFKAYGYLLFSFLPAALTRLVRGVKAWGARRPAR